MINTQQRNPPCWLLCSQRTGSTFISRVMNKFGFTFEEHFAPIFPHTKQHYQTLGQVTDQEERRKNLFQYVEKHPLPAYNKIHYNHFTGFGFQLSDRVWIEEKLPGIRYVMLEREDLLAKVVSMYIVRKANLPGHVAHFTEDSRKQLLEKKIEVDREEIMHLYHTYKRTHFAWLHYLKDSNYLFLSYEKLLSDPEATLSLLLDYLKVPYTPESVTQALQGIKTVATAHPEADYYKGTLEAMVRAEESNLLKKVRRYLHRLRS